MKRWTVCATVGATAYAAACMVCATVAALVVAALGCTEEKKPSAGCGDGFVDFEAGEVCDGVYLRGQQCTDLGFPGGTLACYPAGHPQACRLDTSQCAIIPGCGNGQVDYGEQCDGASLAGQSCQSLGHAGGTLGCTADCLFDISGCTDPECGNNVAELQAGEVCDGTDLAGQTCVTRGYSLGQLACGSDCRVFDESGCSTSAVCGNGIVEGSETCDSTNLAGESCVSLGYAVGDLACHPPGSTEQCTFDDSGCGGTATCTPDFYVGGLQAAVSQSVNGTLAGADDDHSLTCSAAGNDQVITFSTTLPGSLQVDYEFTSTPPAPRFFGLSQAGSDFCPQQELDCREGSGGETGTVTFSLPNAGTYCLIVEELIPLASPYTVTLTLLP